MTMPRVVRHILLFISVGLMLAPVAMAQQPTVLRGTIDYVVDGDTVRIVSRGFQTTIRLIGIDTPETKRPGYPVQCGGPAASAETTRLLPVGLAVRVVSDPSQDMRDKYDRFLGYIYRDGRSGARGSVNYALVANGFAKAYIYRPSGPFRYAPQFLSAEATARRITRGIWGSPCNGDITKPAYSATGTAAGARTGCNPNYSGACIPNTPPDLDCSDITARRFRVVGVDDQRFDSDGDRVACEGSR